MAAKADAGSYGRAATERKLRDEPYGESSFSTPMAEHPQGVVGESLAPAPQMPPMVDGQEFMTQLMSQMSQLMDSKLTPVISQLNVRADSQDAKILKIESDLAALQSKFDDISVRDVPMGEGSKDTLKAELLAELRAESRNCKASKSAPASPRARIQGNKYAYDQTDIDTAMLRLEFQYADPLLALSDVESKVFGLISEMCPSIPKPTVAKAAFKYPNQTSTRIHLEFESKSSRNTVRNSFRKKNEQQKWESCVENCEVWCPEPAFMFHRNRPLLEMRKLIASQKNVSIQSIKVDKNGRKLTLDGSTIAIQNLKTWQVEPVPDGSD